MQSFYFDAGFQQSFWNVQHGRSPRGGVAVTCGGLEQGDGEQVYIFDTEGIVLMTKKCFEIRKICKEGGRILGKKIRHSPVFIGEYRC